MTPSRLLTLGFVRLHSAFSRTSVVPATIAALVLIIVGLFADYQNSIVHRQSMRSDVLAEMSVVRAKLEGAINSNLQLVRGLNAAISRELDMDQERFGQLASVLFEEMPTQLRSIAVAPDFVIRMTYPLEGNERAIGLDYRTDPKQREAALRVEQTGAMVLAGPVDLVQGGQGFVGRFPIYTGDPPDRRLWGLVAAVIDVDRLYKDTGLLDPDLPIRIGIVGKDALGGMGKQFFGEPDIFTSNPVISEVVLPTGLWVMAAVPQAGWDVTPPNAWGLRGFVALLGALVVIPIVLGGRLMEERQNTLRALRRREAELEKLSRRLGLALETSRVGVWEFDIETDDLTWDDRMNEIYGLPSDGSRRLYHHWRDRLHPDDFERAAEDFRVAVGVTGRYHSEYRIVTPAGDVRWVRAIGHVYENPGETRKIVGVNWDVTEDVLLNENLKQANRLSEARNAELELTKARIEHNSLHDSLTGLPNRRYLDEVLRRFASECAADGSHLALLHIDLDRFKQINDTLGHAAGDAMLKHASAVLKANIRSQDFLARIGGDEFVVVCAGTGENAVLAGLAERIITTMRQPVTYQGHECRFGVSVGIAVEAGAQADPSRVLINADIALYRAKSRGRNRHEFFSADLQSDVVRTKRLADEILHGLEDEQFLPYYQPQFDAHTLEVVGIEALARWRHPGEGVVAPSHFLGVAEELNVVSVIDRMILEQALRQFDAWEAAGLGVSHLSVNVSARRLQDEALIESLKGLRIRPGSVSFELVESIYLDESDDIVLFNIDQIKDLGIDIEIDDFGTGYASIVSLMKLKPKRLKIDRQLVTPITDSAGQRRLVASIIDIGKSLDIQVVGEGVETLDHAHILRDLGCDVLQGYAFAKPMSGADATAFLAGGASRGSVAESSPARRRARRAAR